MAIAPDVLDQRILTLPPDERGPIMVRMADGSIEYITAERIATARQDAHSQLER